MKVLVTGGRGFLGKYVVKELEQIHDVTILTHSTHIPVNDKVVFGDIRYKTEIENLIKKVDCVVHLAAKINVERSRVYVNSYIDTNITGTLNVIELCSKYGKKLIHGSTSEVLGNMESEESMRESHPYLSDNPYGATKACAEVLVLTWTRHKDLNASILRPFNVLGTGQIYKDTGSFLLRTIDYILKDKNPVIYGDGEDTRDVVWAGDVAKAYGLLVNGDFKGEVYNCGGEMVTLNYIAKTLIDISGKDLEMEYKESSPIIKRLKCNYDKLKTLGWKPTVKADEALRRIYNDQQNVYVCGGCN